MPRQLDQLPADPTTLARKIHALEQQVRELRAARRAAYTTVSEGAVQVVNSGGTVVAEMTPHGGSENDPGFICYAPAGRPYYAMLSNGYLEFGDTSVTYDVPPFIEHTNNAGEDPSVVAVGSGYIGSTGAYRQALWRLISPATDSGQPRMEVYSDAPGTTCDLTVSGLLTAGNIATGTATITPSAANTPTSVVVGGLNVRGSSFRAHVTPVTSVPGSTAANNGVTGVGYNNLTGSGLTLWVTRQNTTATVVNWMVIGE